VCPLICFLIAHTSVLKCLKPENGLAQYMCTWILPTKLSGADDADRHEDLQEATASTRILKTCLIC